MAEPLNHLCFEVPIMGNGGFIYSQEPPEQYVLGAIATYDHGTLEVGFVPMGTDTVHMIWTSRYNHITGGSTFGVTPPLAYEIDAGDEGTEISVGATSMVNRQSKLDVRVIGGVAGLLSACGFEGVQTDILADPLTLRVPAQTGDIGSAYDFTNTEQSILFPHVDCRHLAFGALEAALAVMTDVEGYPITEVTTNI